MNTGTPSFLAETIRTRTRNNYFLALLHWAMSCPRARVPSCAVLRRCGVRSHCSCAAIAGKYGWSPAGLLLCRAGKDKQFALPSFQPRFAAW